MKLHNSTDRIENEIVLRAPRSRVWRALTNADEFGAWFGMKLQASFTPGSTVSGIVAMSDHERVTIEMAVERMDPESRLSYRWHPYPAHADVDYSSEPTTLVEFQLEEVAGGTLLTVVESGFDRIPVGGRAEAFPMNTSGCPAHLQTFPRSS